MVAKISRGTWASPLLPARHVMNKIGMSKPNASHKIIFDDDSDWRERLLRQRQRLLRSNVDHDFVRGGVGGQGIQGSAESIRRVAAIGLHTPISRLIEGRGEGPRQELSCAWTSIESCSLRPISTRYS
jgi:hypothetical protein